jgi:hypothetical protein
MTLPQGDDHRSLASNLVLCEWSPFRHDHHACGATGPDTDLVGAVPFQ